MKYLYIENKSIISETKQRDISKGQKILAAIYMVTSHLSEGDAIRSHLRELATSLVYTNDENAAKIIYSLEVILGGAVFSGLISEKNSSMILHEAKQFTKSMVANNEDISISNLFSTTSTQPEKKGLIIKDTKKTDRNSNPLLPHGLAKITSDTKSLINKDSRQNIILSFINNRKSAVIKDITSMLPDVSEKTIQRELNRLIDDGKITKRGSKRWSIYMAVNSLL